MNIDKKILQELLESLRQGISDVEAEKQQFEEDLATRRAMQEQAAKTAAKISPNSKNALSIQLMGDQHIVHVWDSWIAARPQRQAVVVERLAGRVRRAAEEILRQTGEV